MMGHIQTYKVKKEKILEAVKDMNRGHEFMGSKVANVLPYDDCSFLVLVSVENSYPSVERDWEEEEYHIRHNTPPTLKDTQ